MLNAAQSVGIAQRLVGKGGDFSAAWLPMALEYERMQGFFNSPPLPLEKLSWAIRSLLKLIASAPPVPFPPNGYAVPTGGRGQRVSLERGVHTRFKKNPGKRHG